MGKMEVLAGVGVLARERGWVRMRRMENETLAHRLGTTAHVSPLLMKARRLGVAVPEGLEELAVARGLFYYSRPADRVSEPSGVYRAGRELSTEEVAICLLSICLPYSQQRIRMGAAMLSAEGNSPQTIARLARMERCERVVHYIASLGRQVEPENSYWSDLLALIPDFEWPRPDLLPHITRFVAMTGYTRNGRATIMQWIRPRVVTPA